jgi:putative endonuclease
LYIGQTQDVEKRMIQHNSGSTISIRNKGPWTLLHATCFETRSEAYQLEQKLKSWKSKIRILAWINAQ